MAGFTDKVKKFDKVRKLDKVSIGLAVLIFITLVLMSFEFIPHEKDDIKPSTWLSSGNEPTSPEDLEDLKRNIGIGGVVVLVLMLLGGGGYMRWKSSNKKPKTE